MSVPPRINPYRDICMHLHCPDAVYSNRKCRTHYEAWFWEPGRTISVGTSLSNEAVDRLDKVSRRLWQSRAATLRLLVEKYLDDL